MSTNKFKNTLKSQTDILQLSNYSTVISHGDTAYAVYCLLCINTFKAKMLVCFYCIRRGVDGKFLCVIIPLHYFKQLSADALSVVFFIDKEKADMIFAPYIPCEAQTIRFDFS